MRLPLQETPLEETLVQESLSLLAFQLLKSAERSSRNFRTSPNTNIYVDKLTSIGSDKGLLPGQRQSIIWTNAGILLVGPLGTNFSEFFIKIQTICLSLYVLIILQHRTQLTTHKKCPNGPISHELNKKFLSFNYDSNDPSRSQICICHDSPAVIMCTKLWPDWIIVFQVKATWIFIRSGS